MSDLADFLPIGGGGFKPFKDFGTVTGLVELDLSEFSSFRVVQGEGDITLSVIGVSEETSNFVDLYFYPNEEFSQSIDNFSILDDGFNSITGVMTNLEYSGILFSTLNEDSLTKGMAFNNDGTKLYIIGQTNLSIYQYSLSVPFDIATSVYDNISYSVSGTGNVPFDIVFNNDGTKLYILQTSSNRIYQYSLSTAFDISTTTYDSAFFSFSGQATGVSSIDFNNDGTKLYTTNPTVSSRRVEQYTLSTPYEVNTATYDFGLNVSAISTPRDSFFNKDGSKLYIFDGSLLYETDLEIPYEVNTAVYNNVSFDISIGIANIYHIVPNKDYSKLYSVRDSSLNQLSASYDFGPLFLYKLLQIGNDVYLQTRSTNNNLKESL